MRGRQPTNVGMIAIGFVFALVWDGPDCAEAKKISKTSSSSVDSTAQIEAINYHINQGWKDYEIKPSALATSGEWGRRVFLDVLGRIPSHQELKKFLANPSSEGKAELVEQLLYEEKYSKDYVRNWTTLWTNILIGRNGGNEENSFISRQGMQHYLRQSFSVNKPYNRMVYELVTATGTTQPSIDNFNGATNFLVMKLEEKASQATAHTARIFLGLQVQCTQCHNHPFNDWKQSRFWEMNAFFRQTVALRRFEPGTRDIRYVELADQDYGGEGGGDPEQAEVFYELRNGLLKSAYPVFVDGTEVSQSGFVTDVNRRQELGRLIMSSPYTQEAIVNRMWSHFLGYGFTKPIDDMRPDNPPTHPELLTYLGEQLRLSGFDLKQLIRWIVLSRPYSLSSRINTSNAQDDPQLGETPKFSRFYLRQMRAEELYESLLVATQAHMTGKTDEDREAAKNRWLSQFTIAFGTDEGDETTTFNGTISQALTMFNGELIRKATSDEKGGFLHTVAHSKVKPTKKIQHLFMAGLARKPTRQELKTANELFLLRAQEAEGDANWASLAALQDIWWAILNSNEFIINH